LEVKRTFAKALEVLRGSYGKQESHDEMKGSEIMASIQERLNGLVDLQKELLGGGLIASGIWASADGQPLVLFNTTAKVSALFNQITQALTKAIQGADFPKLGRYYMIDLADNVLAVVIVMGGYQWGMIIDQTKTTMGTLLNLAMPEMINAFKEIVA